VTEHQAVVVVIMVVVVITVYSPSSVIDISEMLLS
jgi:hypothetical protein